MNNNTISDYMKIYEFYQLISRTEGLSKREYQNSEATFYHFLAELEERYDCKIEQENQRYILVEAGELIQNFQEYYFEENSSKDVNMYLLLYKIAMNGCIGRTKLHELLMEEGVHVSIRQMDNWLKDLLSMGLIRDQMNGKMRSFLINHEKFVMQFLEEKSLLQPKMDLRVQWIEKSRLMKSNQRIEEAITNSNYIQVLTEKGKQLKVIPLSIDYEYEKQRAYLNYIKTPKKAVVERMLLHKKMQIDILEPVKVVITYRDQKEEMHYRFEVLFENSYRILDKVNYYNQQKNYGGIIHKGNEFGYYGFLPKKDIGEFLSWLRGFGSSAIIIKPKKYAKKAMESTINILNQYEVLG